MMPGGSALIMHHCRRAVLDAVWWTDTFVSVTFIATLNRFVRTSLVHENKNNGDKFYRSKFMRAADGRST